MQKDSIQSWMEKAQGTSWSLNSDFEDFERLHRDWCLHRKVVDTWEGDRPASWRHFGQGANESSAAMAAAAADIVSPYMYGEWFWDEHTIQQRLEIIRCEITPSEYDLVPLYGLRAVQAVSSLVECRGPRSPYKLRTEDIFSILCSFPELDIAKVTDTKHLMIKHRLLAEGVKPSVIARFEKAAHRTRLRRKMNLDYFDREFVTEVMTPLSYLARVGYEFSDEWRDNGISLLHVPIDLLCCFKTPEQLKNLSSYLDKFNLVREKGLIKSAIHNRRYLTKSGSVKDLLIQAKYRTEGATKKEWHRFLQNNNPLNVDSIDHEFVTWLFREAVEKSGEALPDGVLNRYITSDISVVRWLIAHIGSKAMSKERPVHAPGGEEFTFNFWAKIDEIKPQDITNGLTTAPDVVFENAGRRIQESVLANMDAEAPLAVCPLGDAPGIVQLKKAGELVLEGKAMNHCVGGFVAACKAGTSFVYHVGDEAPGGYTAEVCPTTKGFRLQQAYGYGDSAVDATIIRRFIRK